MTFWIALGAMLLSVVSTILHFTAPRTKTTWDDRGAELADKIKDKLGN